MQILLYVDLYYKVNRLIHENILGHQIYYVYHEASKTDYFNKLPDPYCRRLIYVRYQCPAPVSLASRSALQLLSFVRWLTSLKTFCSWQQDASIYQKIQTYHLLIANPGSILLKTYISILKINFNALLISEAKWHETSNIRFLVGKYNHKCACVRTCLWCHIDIHYCSTLWPLRMVVGAMHNTGTFILFIESQFIYSWIRILFCKI